MCSIDGNDSKKLRWMFVLANGCLTAGLMLRLFVHANGIVPPAVIDFVVGMLLGVSMAMNFHVIWLRKRNREKRA